jgi:hypothetical protein
MLRRTLSTLSMSLKMKTMMMGGLMGWACSITTINDRYQISSTSFCVYPNISKTHMLHYVNNPFSSCQDSHKSIQLDAFLRLQNDCSALNCQVREQNYKRAVYICM